jgi:hypothetical protein
MRRFVVVAFHTVYKYVAYRNAPWNDLVRVGTMCAGRVKVNDHSMGH